MRIDYQRVYAAVGTNREEIDAIARAFGRHINTLPANVQRRHSIAREMRRLGLSLPQIRDGLGYASHTHLLPVLRDVPRGKLSGRYMR